MSVRRLGPFRLDAKQGDLLLLGHDPVALGRRATALLGALVEQPGVLVSKDALMAAAWPGQIVEDSNLTVQIAALRRALGAVPGGDRWIETMSGRGYRFVGPVDRPVEGADDRPAPASPVGAERRQITALSCELSTLSGPSADAGLEELREANAAFQEHVAQTASRHGGWIVSQLGNAALVLFGYPTALEHDAEQAVRAGVELRDAVRALNRPAALPTRCRVGIATGMTIIGEPGTGGGPDGREVFGGTPDLAVQLRLSAPPDGVVIEPATRGLIGELFDCRDFATVATGDRVEPTRSWQVMGEGRVASRFEALRGPAASRLIGRDEEIALLQLRWARAAAGEGQVVLIAGEAGLGKSRLAAELQSHLRDQPHSELAYSGSPHHQDSALFPFVNELERACGLEGDDLPATRLEKLATQIAGADAPQGGLAFLADLLGLPTNDPALADLSASRKKARTLEALLRRWEGLARRQPLLVILEDAHWIDATSRELLDLAVEQVRGLPVLLVVTFRPEFQPPWTGQPHVTTRSLNRLDRRDRISLAAQIAGKTLPDTVLDQIAARTDGVPLFVEELTKGVLESGLLRAETDRFVLRGPLPSVAVPTTLYASLLARLDRSATGRRVAQAGAAIGPAFSYPLVRAVCGLPEDQLQSALAELVASELLFQRGIPPDATYSFKHALVRDVAYGSLVRSARAQLHAAIAEALETQTPELMDAQPELFGQHYAAGGLAEKAFAAWAKAGLRSAARSALTEAAAQFQSALDQLALTAETPERLRKELEVRSALGAVLRFVKGQAAPETGREYARTALLWAQLGSPPEFRHVPYGQSVYHVYRGELGAARRVGEDLLTLSRERGDGAGVVLGHSAVGQSLLLAGGFAASRPHLESVLTLYDPGAHGGLVQQAGSHPLMTQAFLGLALFCLGFPDQAMARSADAIAEARRLAHPASLAVGLAIGAQQALLVGDAAGLDRRAAELEALAREQGLTFFQAWADIHLGYAGVQVGDGATGLELLRRGVGAYRATGAMMYLPDFLSLQAAGHTAAGQIDRAAAILDEALQIIASTGEYWSAAELVRQKGDLLLRQGQIGAAAARYGAAIGIAQRQGARLWELRAAVSLARLQFAQGEHDEARGLLGPIYGGFTEGLGTSDLQAARALLAGASQ